ncbi:MAG: HlyD family secretion protein [Chthoniobacterales bacterium]
MKTRKYLITFVVLILAGLAAWLLFSRYEHHPWTRDAQIQANIVGIAPRVAGPIINIPITDNQTVKKGDLLFEIDPATFQAAVANAAANVQKAQADLTQKKQSMARQTTLFQQKVTDVQDYQNAQDSYNATAAQLNAAEASLKTAQLNLSYTKIFAPVDGYLTNVNTSPGTYVNEGQQLLALVDASSFWVAAYFKETQIKFIQEGNNVEITLMGHFRQSFTGVIKSIGWGIFISNGSTNELLPQVYQTIDWVRLPQRFPVRIHITGKPPVPLRIGQTASVSVEPAK